MPSAVKLNYQSAASRLVITLRENGRRVVWGGGKDKKMEEEPKMFLVSSAGQGKCQATCGPD